MSLQDSTFGTIHVLDNEIIKANDFEYAFEQIITNVSRATQMFLESSQDFVINGKVLPYQGMNLKVSPIYGVCKATGIPFGRTEQTDESIGFEESSSGRIDIIEVQGEWQTYDEQQRAFNDPDTDTQTYQYVDTKKLMKPVYRVKQGEEGGTVAPEVDSGWVKLAEVVIRANNSTILEADIKNITADIAGENNTGWTTDVDATYNIGYISDINERFRVQHNGDGTHKDNCINSDSLDIGVGVKQINGNVLPVGGTVSIPNQTVVTTDSIISVINKIASLITSLYNSYLKFGSYGFKGEVQISSIVDSSNVLQNPLKISADGSGNATIKIGSTTVLSIDSTGKLSTNGYTATANNHLVTKAVTDAISNALSVLTTRVDNIVVSLDYEVYSNNTLSSGADGRYNIDATTIYTATTENISLSGTQTIDGTSPSDGSYILVKNQTDAKENGIYQYSSSSLWSRVTAFLSPNDLKGKLFQISNGTVNSGKLFYIPKENFVDGTDFGSDDINFSEYFGSVKALANKVVVRDSSGKIVGNVTGNVSGSSGSCTGTAENANNLGNKSLDTVYKMSNAGGICTTAAATQTKSITIPGFTLYEGVRVTVLFKNSCTTDWPKFTVNTAAAKPIRCTRAGVYHDLTGKFGYWRGASSSFKEVWQAGTVLTLIYTGNEWVIEGNSILESYYSTTNSYVVYADGKIEQWGHSTTQTSTSTVLTYLVPFSSATSYSISGNDVYDDRVAANLQMYNKTASSCKVFRQNQASTNWDWRAVGY